MTGGRQRGRPKKPMPASPLGPAPMRGVGLKEQSQFSEMLASIDAAEADLIGGVREKRPTLTNVHALGLALENELNETERASLFEVDAALRSAAKKYVEKGGKETGIARKKSTDARVQIVGKKSQQLIAKTKPNGMLSISSAAEILLNRWDELGDGGEKPSLSTARRWLKRLATSS